jgi:hypothetical protein
MKPKEVPFWETNLNPITMFAPSIPNAIRLATGKKSKGNYLKSIELDDYVSALSLRKEFSIGAKRLQDLFMSIGTHPKYNSGNTYYSIEYVERARELLSQRKEKEQIDTDKYISNQELMEMFGFNTNKAHYITSNSNLIKVRFSRNVNYYEREKAIAAFSKYIKK